MAAVSVSSPPALLISIVLLLSAVDLSSSFIPPSTSPASSPFPAPEDFFPSPPAPPPDLSLSISLSPRSSLSPPAPAPKMPSPALTPFATPSPAPVSLNKEIRPGDVADSEAESDRAGGGGMSAGKKVAIALGLILGAAVLVAGAVVYKKRQDNIRRSRYGDGSLIEMF